MAKIMTVEDAFVKLISSDWENLPKEFKEKYKAYRSKYVNKRGCVGYSIKIEMLEKCDYKIYVKK